MTQVKNQNNNRIGNRMNVKYTGSQPHRHFLFSNKPKEKPMMQRMNSKLLKRSVDPPTLQPNYRSITYDIPRLRFERKIQPKPSDQLTTIAKHAVALQCHRRGSTIHGCFTYPCMSSMANRFTLEQILRKRAQKTLEIQKLVLVCIC